MDYRREIDGLRAIAVTAVVVYHFWPRVFVNGFLGVDIFFVISGYLMTQYIYETSSHGNFSLIIFYQRRIRRIIPLTLFILAVTTIMAAIILINVDFSHYCESLIASLTFTSNIYFWRDGGYFGQSDSLKPLLHIWSLSVEEQFYIVYPIALFTLLKISKSIKVQIFVISLTAIVSFLSNLYMHQIGGANPAFFLMPFRVWEFGAGALATLTYVLWQRQHSAISLLASVIFIGLGLTILAKFIISGLMVVMGTALFLSMRFPHHVIFISQFFLSRLICYLGQISFSTYLWHWPLVVFLGYITIVQPNNSWIFGILILTYVLSMISYHYIEQPFRKSIKPNLVIKYSFLITILLLVFAIICRFLFPFGNDESYASKVAASIQSNYRCHVSEYRSYGASRACIINSKADNHYTLALLGNSHVQMYVPAIEPYLRMKNEKGLLVPLNGCLPTVQINISSECIDLARKNLEAIINDEAVTTVIIGLTWYDDQLVGSSATVFTDNGKEILFDAIFDLISTIENHGKNVFLMGPLMIPGFDLPSVLSRRIKFDSLDYQSTKEMLRVDRTQFDAKFGNIMRKLKGKLGERFLDPTHKFCDSSYCYYGDEDGVYFADSSHLSAYGVAKLKELFGEITPESN